MKKMLLFMVVSLFVTILECLGVLGGQVWILDIDKVGRFLISVKYHAVSKLLKRFETRLTRLSLFAG
jgi:hypothetical protein